MYVIFALLLLTLIFLLLNNLYTKTNYYQNQIEQILKFKNEIPSSLDMVNLGSSYARFALDYRCINVNGFNFALMPQSLSYDFKILKQYISSLNDNCIVFISLPNLVFGFLDYENEYNNIKYYHFLEKSNINRYSALKKIIYTKFPLLNYPLGIIKLVKDSNKDDRFFLSENKLSYLEVEKEATIRVNSWINQFKLKDMQSVDLPENLISMFSKTTSLVEEIIDYCIDHNFRPVILIPPQSKIISDMISKEFMQKVLYDNISLCNKRNIPVFDYLYDYNFQDFSLYVNSDFLNSNGRILFSKTVYNNLKKIKYIEENKNE